MEANILLTLESKRSMREWWDCSSPVLQTTSVRVASGMGTPSARGRNGVLQPVMIVWRHTIVPTLFEKASECTHMGRTLHPGDASCSDTSQHVVFELLGFLEATLLCWAAIHAN